MRARPRLATRSRGKGSGSAEHPVDLSSEAHRRLIGYLGLALPVLLYLVSGLRPTGVLPPWAPLDSISAYYYSGAIAIFVGVLFGLALFLFTYQGFSDSWEDRALGRVGAICAVCVALFPTEAPDGVAAPAWLGEATPRIHYAAAAALFVVFILFSLWLFRRTDTPKGTELPPDKRTRNRIFTACGLVMIGCVLWASVAGALDRPILWAEVIALWAFAFSWLVKGRARRSLARGLERVVGSVSRGAPPAGEAGTGGGTLPSR